MTPGGWRAHLSPFDWGALLTAGAVVESCLLLLIGLVLGDLETITFGVVVAATTALLFARRNRLALLVRFAVFADVAYWMTTGALSNLSHGTGVGAVIQPLALAVTSLVGMAASVVSLIPGRRTQTTGTAQVAVAAALVFLTGSVFAAINHSGVAAAKAEASIGIKNARYSSTRLTAVAHGGRVTIKVTNHDLFWHTFTAPELGIDERFAVHAERTLTIRAKPGTYRFFCAIPGHAQIGMKGTLTVS